MNDWLDFEKPVQALSNSAAELRALNTPEALAEVPRQEERATRLLAELYGKLTPVQRLGVARHPARPHFKDYVAGMIEDFTPLAGDRGFGEDAAIIGGLGRLHGRTVMVIGHEKGADTATRVKHNFGMGRPEGYRKAIRLMEMAGRFGVPVVTLLDTPGAYPGLEGEARGQAEAIARSTQACLDLPVPMVAAIVGEGMSGGAVGLAAANRVLMFEHAVYAVISPEGCASILWRGETGKAAEAAEAMKITASDLLRLGVIDSIVNEPTGGAHRDPSLAIERLGAAITAQLAEMDGQDATTLRKGRREKFLAMGRA
jgi:acetyl-CoA carboxylase carboxyl transferase subunit alpha